MGTRAQANHTTATHMTAVRMDDNSTAIRGGEESLDVSHRRSNSHHRYRARPSRRDDNAHNRARSELGARARRQSEDPPPTDSGAR
jgi:hypothetical protein